MKYDETYSDLFDVAHDLLEEIDPKIGYCNKDGHLHDPYNDFVYHRKIWRENDYYCDSCGNRYSEKEVSDAKMLWTIVRYHFEGFKELIKEGDYQIFLSTVESDRRIELVARKSARYLDEEIPKQIVLKDVSDLEKLPEQYNVESESDSE